MLKKYILIGFTSLFMSIVTVNCQAEGTLGVSRQVTLETPPPIAWALLGEFNGLNKWHPAVAKSTLASGNGTKINSKRVLTLGDGALIKETLLDYNASNMSYTYNITESPLPVSDYVSTINIEEDAQGNSKVTWTSSFNPAGVTDGTAIEVITGVYDAGLSALEAKY